MPPKLTPPPPKKIVELKICITSLQITFLKTGLKEYSGKIEGFGPVLTLKDAIKQHGDTGKRISYLKVSYESSKNNIKYGKL